MMHPDQTRAACAAQLARVDAMFDEAMAHARNVQALYASTGHARSTATRERQGDAEVRA